MFTSFLHHARYFLLSQSRHLPKKSIKLSRHLPTRITTKSILLCLLFKAEHARLCNPPYLIISILRQRMWTQIRTQMTHTLPHNNTSQCTKHHTHHMKDCDNAHNRSIDSTHNKDTE